MAQFWCYRFTNKVLIDFVSCHFNATQYSALFHLKLQMISHILRQKPLYLHSPKQQKITPFHASWLR